MTTERTDWRFFTRLNVDDCAVTQTWCWEEFIPGRNVVSTGCGFTTLPAAMRDARRNGFDADDDIEGQPPLRRVDDWARAEDVLDKPFHWMNHGGHEGEWAVVDDTRVVAERRGLRRGATLRN